MKRLLPLLLGTLIILIGSTITFGQSDLQIFGFFQTTLTKLNGGYSVVSEVPPSIFGTSQLTLDQQQNDYLSPSVQQLNIFARKEIDQNFTAWVNLEITGTYNSRLNWGGLTLQEAWVNYQSSDALNIKAGILVPRFAYLNEIKNKMPLLPYIFRPLAYESSVQNINDEDYVPQRAFLQVFGNLSSGNIIFDYAAFVGPSESSYISSNVVGGYSVDTTDFKLFGARVGLKYKDLGFGISGTSDKSNQKSTIKQSVPRTRLAFDLEYSAYNFFLNSEYIAIHLSPQNTTQNLDKLFYYGTLGYNFNDNLLAYGSYSYITVYDDLNGQIAKAGMKSLTFGLDYKPTSAVVLKASVSHFYGSSNVNLVLNPSLPAFNTDVDVNIRVAQLAVSVLF